MGIHNRGQTGTGGHNRHTTTGPDPHHNPPTTNLTDLMTQVAAGNHEAFTTLYNQLAAPIFGLILRLLRNRAQSEEVAQEVMLEIWRTATRYQPDRGTVTTWALTLAHRRAVDRIRSEQAATNREHTTATHHHTTAYDHVTEHIEHQLETEQIRHCLTTLTHLQHQAITLAYYHGYTYRQVATHLNTPLGTIKTRLRDALIRLRTCMHTTT